MAVLIQWFCPAQTQLLQSNRPPFWRNYSSLSGASMLIWIQPIRCDISPLFTIQMNTFLSISRHLRTTRYGRWRQMTGGSLIYSRNGVLSYQHVQLVPFLNQALPSYMQTLCYSNMANIARRFGLCGERLNLNVFFFLG